MLEMDQYGFKFCLKSIDPSLIFKRSVKSYALVMKEIFEF